MKKIILLATAIFASAVASADAWRYSENTDAMTGKKRLDATIRSDNNLSFDFPYQGENSGFLSIQKDPKHGNLALLWINKGQMLCHYRDCNISVRFDDAQPVTYSGSAPADHSSTGIFLDNAQGFIARAKKAKKILVQFNAYQNGAPVLTFSSAEPLQWGDAKAPAAAGKKPVSASKN
jgi:hypothetical protein